MRGLYVAGTAMLALVAWQPASAAPAPFAAIFDDLAKPDVPGCTVAVVENGKQSFAGAFGMADIDGKRPLLPETIFDAASVSKQFTAFTILRLQQLGKLSLNDSVRKFVPELGAYADAVTLRHLLHHTSGLRDFISLSRIGPQVPGEQMDAARALKILARQTRAEVPPGTEQTYSNTGYLLLGIVAERAGKRPMQSLLQEYVFKPLGMNSTSVGDPDTAGGFRPTVSYMAAAGKFTPVAPSANLMLGAGGLRTTAGDLGKWAQNYWTGKAGGTALTKQMAEVGALRDGTPIDYAAGVTVANYRGLVTLGHGGSVDGFRNKLLVIPSERFATAILCNRSDAAPGERGDAIADIALAKRLQPKPAVPQSAQLPATDRILPAAAQTGAYRDRKGAEYLAFRRDETGKPILDYRGRPFPLEAVSGHIYKTEPLQSFPIYLAFSPGRISMAYAGYRDEFEFTELWKPDELQRWVGLYQSTEADAAFRIVQGERGLVGEMGALKVPLQPGRRGEFVFGRGALTVPTDGPADWVELYVVGMRGLRFTRTDGPSPAR